MEYSTDFHVTDEEIKNFLFNYKSILRHIYAGWKAQGILTDQDSDYDCAKKVLHINNIEDECVDLAFALAQQDGLIDGSLNRKNCDLKDMEPCFSYLSDKRVKEYRKKHQYSWMSKEEKAARLFSDNHWFDDNKRFYEMD